MQAPFEPHITARPRTNARHATASLALLASIPILLFVVSPNWIYTNPFILPWFDPWVYFGLMRYAPEYVPGNIAYYPSGRIPQYIWGYGLYALLKPSAANAVLKFVLHFTATTALWLALSALATNPIALFTAVIFGTYSFFIASAGWDYVDGYVITYALLGYACLARANPGTRQGGGLVLLGGACFACMIFSHAFSVILLPFALGLGLVSRHAGRALSFRALAADVTRFALGFAGMTVLIGLVSLAFGGQFLFFEPQIAAAAHYQSVDDTYGIKNYGYLLLVSTWNALPLAVGLASLGALAATSIGAKRRRETIRALLADRRRAMELWLLLQLVGLLLLYVVVTLRSVAVLTFWFYVSYLSPAVFLALGCLFARWQRRTHFLAPAWFLLATAVLLALAYAHGVGAFVQSKLAIGFGNTPLVLPFGILLASGALLALAAWLRASVILCFAALAAALVGMAASNIAMATHPQLNFSFSFNRHAGFRAIDEGLRAIQSRNVDGPVQSVWVAVTEQPLGGNILWALYITNIMRLGPASTTTFPELPATYVLKPGDRVALATGQPAALDRARALLRERGLGVKLIDTKRITRPEVSYAIYFLECTAPTSPEPQPGL